MKMTNPKRWPLPKFASPKVTTPKFAQITGMLVTSIVVFGLDIDVLFAVPLGILAGAIATFFVALSDFRREAKKG